MSGALSSINKTLMRSNKRLYKINPCLTVGKQFFNHYTELQVFRVSAWFSKVPSDPEMIHRVAFGYGIRRGDNQNHGIFACRAVAHVTEYIFATFFRQIHVEENQIRTSIGVIRAVEELGRLFTVVHDVDICVDAGRSYRLADEKHIRFVVLHHENLAPPSERSVSLGW